jgi:hypothetical protein
MTASNRTNRRREASLARTPANRARGESVLVVPGQNGAESQEFKLCLTLAAIAIAAMCG